MQVLDLIPASHTLQPKPMAVPKPASGGQLRTPITVASGDGIGPEIMQATLRILEAGGALLAPENIHIGEQIYLSGNTSGIAPAAWDSLRRTKVFLKAPITTPSGGGYKSLNVTIRKTLGLYANVRPCASYHPFVATPHPGMDVVIVRENEEDLYAGIEHRQTDDVVQCLKLISRPGCEKIVRYAFEYALAHGRKKVTCMTKDNIMKMTDGLFHKVFDEIRAEYPQIAADHMIIDIGTARLATRPGDFDVIVTPNLYGDIISDVAAELTGSVGLGGSANIGEHVAMFEAIHGSAPDIAGRDMANPAGLLLGAVMMLVHIGQVDAATRIHNALLATLEDGILTADLMRNTHEEKQAVGTQAFTDAVIARMGRTPRQLAAVNYAMQVQPAPKKASSPKPARKPALKTIVGVDIFLHAPSNTQPNELAAKMLAMLASHDGLGFQLQMVTNRGVKVWPNGFDETFCTDHWRCRFMGVDKAGAAANTSHLDIIALLQAVHGLGLDFIKMENLCAFDGEAGFALGQGQ